MKMIRLEELQLFLYAAIVGSASRAARKSRLLADQPGRCGLITAASLSNALAISSLGTLA